MKNFSTYIGDHVTINPNQVSYEDWIESAEYSEEEFAYSVDNEEEEEQEVF